MFLSRTVQISTIHSPDKNEESCVVIIKEERKGEKV